MKHTDIVQVKPFTLRPKEAAALFGAPRLFQDMVRAGWIKPCYKAHRCTLYLFSDLEACARRLAQGERPKVAALKTPSL